jgi:hypothetical protein
MTKYEITITMRTIVYLLGQEREMNRKKWITGNKPTIFG